MAERTLIKETATLQSNIYFTEYVIAPESNVRIWLLDTNNSKVLELKEIHGEILNSTEFNVDRNRGLIFFNPELLGNTIYIEYFSDLTLNPLYVYDELYRLAYEMAKLSYMSVTGCLINFDPYTGNLKVSEGIISFNNNIYTFNGAEEVINTNNITVGKSIVVYIYEPLVEDYAVYNTLSKFQYDIIDITYRADGSFDVDRLLIVLLFHIFIILKMQDF